jgi:hypothetical protein
LAAIGEDGAGMKFATVAVAGRLAALSLQRVERARQEGIALEAGLKEARQELLEMEEFGAEGTKLLVHEHPGGRAAVYYYIIIPTDLARVSWRGRKK